MLQRLAHLAQRHAHVGLERLLPRRHPLEQREDRGAPQDQVRLHQDPPRRLGQTGEAVVADPQDHQLRSGIAHRRPSSLLRAAAIHHLLNHSRLGPTFRTFYFVNPPAG